jgi:hypothetical protein
MSAPNIFNRYAQQNKFDMCITDRANKTTDGTQKKEFGTDIFVDPVWIGLH